jgi:hypothetical protein
MQTTTLSLALGAALGTGLLVLSGGCGSGELTQGTGDGGATSDLAGSVNPEADPKLQGITELHNQARSGVLPQPATAVPPLTWDSTVAAAAQTWANGCKFQHSSNGYGENIYASTGSATPSAIVSSWVSEKTNYTYSTNTCSGTCGHYTQVVWRASVHLGCAQKTCTTGSPFGTPTWQFVVCDYDPPGNFNGQKPY